MVTVGLGPPNHDNLVGVSTADHHTATVASDINLADLAERLHGSLTSLASTDHLPSLTQAAMESEDVVARGYKASQARHAPSAAKAWCKINGVGSLLSPSYNTSSVTDVATGNRIVVFDDDFSTDVYAASGELMQSPATRPATLEFLTAAVGSIVVLIHDNGVLVDLIHGQCFFGDQ